MTVTRKWSLLAAVLVLAIFAAGWFLLISPKRGEAAALRADTVTQEDANSRLEQKIAMLQAQQADLPKQRARLAVIRRQIPNNPALPTMIRNLSAAGKKVGISLDSMAPSLPEPVVLPLPVAAAANSAATAGTSSSTTDSTTGASGTTTAATPAAPPAPSLYQVPLKVQVTGSYFELEQFVNKLEGLKRSFQVVGFTIGEPTSDEATAGDLMLELSGRVFLAPEAATAASAATTTQPATTGTTPAGQ